MSVCDGNSEPTWPSVCIELAGDSPGTDDAGVEALTDKVAEPCSGGVETLLFPLLVLQKEGLAASRGGDIDAFGEGCA